MSAKRLAAAGRQTAAALSAKAPPWPMFSGSLRRPAAAVTPGGTRSLPSEAGKQRKICGRKQIDIGAVKTVMGAWQYDSEDIERLSMIMTLHDIGFAPDEIANYIRLWLRGNSTQAERMRILKQQRDKTLDEIHFQERRLDRLDYLRHQIRRQANGPKTS